MRVAEGDKARDFSVTDIFGSRISLGDFEGRKTLLSFYRYASCPLCNLRIRQLIKELPGLSKKGLAVLAFFESPKGSIKRYICRQDVPFPMIADPERQIYRLYGVESSWLGFLKGCVRPALFESVLVHGFMPGRMEGDKALLPADFLIGPDLTVSRAYYGRDAGDHVPVNEIQEFLA